MPARPAGTRAFRRTALGLAGAAAAVALVVATAADSGSRRVQGQRAVPPGDSSRILIQGSKGRLRVGTSDKPALSWDCQIEKSKPDPVLEAKPGQLLLDLTYLSGADCRIEIPRRHELALQLGDGELRLEQPRTNVDARLGNGQVSIEPDPKLAYRYDLTVANGRVEAFPSSNDPAALRIHAAVTNGAISHHAGEE